MTPTEAIEYIHSRLTFGIHPGMERIRALCAALGNPQDELRFIHVAGTNGKLDSLIPTMVKHKGEKYLVPMSSVHNDDVKQLLDSKKLNHTECVMYRTVSNDFTEEEAAKFDCNMLVFFSPSGIKAFTKNFPSFEQNDVRIATFGPATAKAVTDAGYRLDLEAPTKEHPSMTSALRYYLENNK